jgi:RNA polymerase sigma factor (sigma-70 family)
VTGYDGTAAAFEEHRAHLTAVAFRILGSVTEAEDAVQEAWLRLDRSGPDGVANLGGWLTTVVGRVALDMLRARGVRRRLDDDLRTQPPTQADPEDDAVLADTVGAALLVVLDTLTPPERLAFVLHDMFAVPFEDIGTVLERSPQAAKQLAHRARRKVRGQDPAAASDPVRQRAVVDAFLAASRDGDFEALVALLHPDVVLVADAAAVAMGSSERVRGAAEVAAVFSGRALAARAATVGAGLGLVWAVNGRPRVAWAFTIGRDGVVAIEMIADPGRLAGLEVSELA